MGTSVASRDRFGVFVKLFCYAWKRELFATVAVFGF